MVHRHKAPAVPGKDETFGPTAAPLVIEIRLPPFAAGKPALPVPEIVAADAGPPEPRYGPQVLPGPPSLRLRLPLGHEFGREFPMVRLIQAAEDLRVPGVDSP